MGYPSTGGSGSSGSSYDSGDALSDTGIKSLSDYYIPIYNPDTGKLSNSKISYDSDTGLFNFDTSSIMAGTDTLFLGEDTSISAANGYLSGEINGTKYLFSSIALGAGNTPKFPLMSTGGTRSVQTTNSDTLDASSGISNTYTASGDEIIYQLTFNPTETGTLKYVVQKDDADGSIIRYVQVAVTATGEQTFDINPFKLADGDSIYCTLTGVSVLGSSTDGPYLLAEYYTNADTNIAYDGCTPTFDGLTSTDDILFSDATHNLGSYSAPVSKSHNQSIRFCNTNYSTSALAGCIYASNSGSVFYYGNSDNTVNMGNSASSLNDISISSDAITLNKTTILGAAVTFGDDGSLDGSGVVYGKYTYGVNTDNSDYPYATITDGTDTFGLMPLYDTPEEVDINDLTTPGVFAVPVSGSSRIPSNRDDSITQLAVLSATYNAGASGGYIAFGAGADTSDDQNLLAVRAWTGTTRSDWFYAALYNSSISLTDGDVLTATGNGSEFEATAQTDLTLPTSLMCKMSRAEYQTIQSDWTSKMDVSAQADLIRTAPDIFGWDSYHTTIKQDGFYRVTFNVSCYSMSNPALFRVCTASGSTTSDILMGCIVPSDFGYGNGSCTGRFNFSADDTIYVVCYSDSQFRTSYVDAQGDTSLDVEWLSDTLETGPSAYS